MLADSLYVIHFFATSEVLSYLCRFLALLSFHHLSLACAINFGFAILSNQDLGLFFGIP